MARIQGKLHSNGATSSPTVAVTLDAPVSSGNLVVVAVGTAVPGNSPVVFTCADDKGNTYTAVDVGDGNNFQWGSFYLQNITNGPQTITVAIDAGASSRQFSTIIATEFSGVQTTSPLDGHSINIFQAGTNTTDGITSGSATTTANGDLIWGACVNLSGSSTLVVGTGYTLDQNSGSDFVTEYRTQTTAGSVASTWTGTSADSFSSLMMAFKTTASTPFTNLSFSKMDTINFGTDIVSYG